MECDYGAPVDLSPFYVSWDFYFAFLNQEGGFPVKHKMYSVYDSKAQVWMKPIYMRADGEAIRAFKASIADSNHQFGMNPADYTMFGIGEFDDDKGIAVAYDTFVNLGNGVQHMPQAAGRFEKDVNNG